MFCFVKSYRGFSFSGLLFCFFSFVFYFGGYHILFCNFPFLSNNISFCIKRERERERERDFDQRRCRVLMTRICAWRIENKIRAY